MEVLKESWHYKLVKYVFSEPSKSLCLYFWQIVISCLVMISLSMIVLFVLVIFVFTPLLTVYLFISSDYTDYENYAGLMTSGIIVIGFYVALASFKLIGYTRKRLSCNKKTKEPGIVVQYIKAKKQKVCPRITFKD